jgi:hypothetical protein
VTQLTLPVAESAIRARFPASGGPTRRVDYLTAGSVVCEPLSALDPPFEITINPAPASATRIPS